VLYTDGVVEHSRDVLAGEAALLDAVGRAVASGMRDIAGSVANEIFKDRRVADDVAIMTVAFSCVDVRDGRSTASRAAGTPNVSGRTIA
jgi:hypothetical protein